MPPYQLSYFTLANFASVLMIPYNTFAQEREALAAEMMISPPTPYFAIQARERRLRDFMISRYAWAGRHGRECHAAAFDAFTT